MITEGGKAIPSAVPVTPMNIDMVTKNLNKAMPLGIDTYPIGSAGKKSVSSDVDVLIDADQLLEVFPLDELKLARQALEKHFANMGLETKRTGVSVHVGIPNGDGGVAQVDIMAVQNAKAAQPLHTHDYTDSQMKGGTLHAMWADLANMSATPEAESLMMSPYKGLVNRETKELVTNNKDEIAKIIIGPSASADDMGNPTKLLKALEPYPKKYDAIKNKYMATEWTQKWQNLQ